MIPRHKAYAETFLQIYIFTILKTLVHFSFIFLLQGVAPEGRGDVQHRRGQVEEEERAARGRHGHFGHRQRRVGPGLRAGGGGVGGPGKGVEASPGLEATVTLHGH